MTQKVIDLKFQYEDNIGLDFQPNKIAIYSLSSKLRYWKNGVYLRYTNGQKVIPKKLKVIFTPNEQRYFKTFTELRDGEKSFAYLSYGESFDKDIETLTLSIHVSPEYLVVARERNTLREDLEKMIIFWLYKSSEESYGGYAEVVSESETKVASERILSFYERFKPILLDDSCVGIICNGMVKARSLLRLIIGFFNPPPVYAGCAGGPVSCGNSIRTCKCPNGNICTEGSVCSFFPFTLCSCSTICDYGDGVDMVCSFRTTQSSCNYANSGACSDNGYDCQSGSCTWTCVPSCSAPLCGQSNGCGGWCSNADASNWSDTGNRSCGGGCGTQSCQKEQSNPCGGFQWVADGSTCNECGPYGSVTCGDWTQTYDCRGPDSGCQECGPYPSSWSACSSATFDRTRTCTEDCGSDNCAGVPLTDNCQANISGTFFDASDLSDCAAMAAAPKITGGTIQIDSSLYAPPVSYTPSFNGSGVYSQTVRSPETYSLTVNPGGGYIAAPKFVCQGSWAAFPGSAPGCGSQPCEAGTFDFGFWRIYGGWWQATGGSVYGGTGITSIIPASLPVAEQYLILDDANGQNGVALFRTGSVDLGTAPLAAVSASGWQASSGINHSRRGDFNYNYYLNKMNLIPKTSWNGSGKPAFTPIPGKDYQVFTSDTATIDFNLAAGEKMVFLVSGDVTIPGDASGNVDVPEGSFLSVIAGGDITISSAARQIEGWYNGENLTVQSIGDEATELQFVGEGAFIGWETLVLSRDRGVTNNTEPAEKFIARPDFMVNAPEVMKVVRATWKEVAP
ncbi:hypothetical protein HY333_00575 [Candidatus Collierbacteria bacterium]|nr:hypothetical protein [Candidatus Collierbacteria bacterium]